MNTAHNAWLRRGTRQVLFLLLASNLLFVPDCAAQLSAADLLTTPRFSIFEQFALSPDNSSVAYTVERTEPEYEPGDSGSPLARKWKKTSELWISDLRTSQSFRVCCDDGNAMLPAWSPDGQRLAFYKTPIFLGADRSKTGMDAFERDASLVVRDEQTGVTREYLKGECPYSCSYVGALWLSDGYSLLVPARPMEESDSRRAPQPSGTVQQEISSDSNRQADPTIRILTSTSSAQQDPKRRSAGRPDRAHLVRSAGRPAIDMRIIDTKTGQSKRVLKNFHIAYSALSPDRKNFAFADYEGSSPNSIFGVFDIFVIDLDTLKVRNLLSAVGIYPGSPQPLTWSADARLLAVSDQSVDPNSNSKVFSDYVVLDTLDGSSRRIVKDTSEAWFGARTAVWSGDGRYLSFIRNNRLETWDVKRLRLVSKVSIPNKRLESIVSAQDGQVPNPGGKVYAIIVTSVDLTTLKAGFWEIQPEWNRARKLLEADERFSFYANFERLIFGGSRALFVSASTGHPDELYQADRNFTRVQRVTNLASGLDRVSMGRSEIVTWKNAQGNRLRGVLLLPSNFERNHRYPLIVTVYPVPIMTFKKNGFGLGSEGPSQNWQIFATRGYAVFMPDIPTRPSAKMPDIARAVLPGVQELIKRGIADPAKIGVVGHSDGGYATLALLVQSRLFRAAIMIDGHGDLIEDSSYDYLRLVIEESWGFKKTPWEDLDLYIRNSPYLYLDKVQTPLLILHGSSDMAVPVHLGEEVFAGLRRLGKEATFVAYEGEDHDPAGWSIPHQLDVSQRMISWFGEHLKQDLRGSASLRVRGVTKNLNSVSFAQTLLPQLSPFNR